MIKVLEDIKAGKWVWGIQEEIGVLLRENEARCFRLNSLSPEREEERRTLVREIFGEIGENFVVHSPMRCDFGKNIFIGENFIANFNLTVLDEAEVHIGDNVFIGPNCSIYTVNHALLPQQRNPGVMRADAVTIGSNVWIGGNVVILPGVTIGDGAVIGAGSVVTRSIPGNVIAVGSPAKVVREITADDEVTDIAEP